MSASDPVFEAYVRAAEADAVAALERVVATTLPAIRDVCRAAAGISREDTEDAAADALAHVIARVRLLRETAAGAAIQNLAAYAAVTARRVCADRLRSANPVRARLASRVRYALTHDPRLRLRRDDRGVYAGLAAWRDGVPPASGAAATRTVAGMDPRLEGAGLLATIRTLLDRVGGWVEVGALVGALFDGAGLREPAFTPAEDVELPAPGAAAPTDEGGQSGALTAVWVEITSLPLRQRAALLLHLRDDAGRPVLPLLVPAGVATLGSIADALAMTPAELDELWPSLPLDDLRIAERLGATRQQVINLRKSARARLARRLTKRSLPVVIQERFGRQIRQER